MHILVVEDDAELGEVLADFLQEQGHRVTVAVNAPHALRLVGSLQPDVLLIDIGLPVFDGNFLAAEIRRGNDRTSRLIALTGSTELVQPGLFDQVILKPMSPPELLRALVTPVGVGLGTFPSAGLQLDDVPEDTRA